MTISIDDDIAQLDAAREQDKQDESHAAFVKSGGQAHSTGVSDWVMNLPKNLTVGLFDAAVNTVKTIGEMGSGDAVDKSTVQAGGALLQPTNGEDIQKRREAHLAQPFSDPQHDGVMDHVMAFRDELAKGNTADVITQGAAQFAIPFMGWSKLLGVANAASVAQKAVRVAGAEAATAATALDPHAPRMADLYQLGQHVEGKLGDTLNAIAPDGGAVNAYIDYMTDRVDEGAAEGRFKNVIDTLVPSAITAGLVKAGSASLKAARKLPDYLPAKMPEGAALRDEGAAARTLGERTLQQLGDVPTAIVHLKEAGDALPLAQGKQFYDAADHIRQTAGPGVGVKVVESPQGFTVVHGHEPSLTFKTVEDANAAVVDMHEAFGAAYQTRQAQARAKLTDSNFDTLHSFSRVLQKNADRPVSTHSLVSALEQNLKGDTEQGAFYKELLGRLKGKNLGGMTTVTSKAGRTPHDVGYYDGPSNGIELHPGAFNSPARLLHTFSHEAVHAATLREMNESPRVLRAVDRIRTKIVTATKEAEAKIQAAASSTDAGAKPPKVQQPYGFTNAYEFVAEIESNPEFRASMKKVKTDDGSAWDSYLKAIAGILGVAGLAVNPEFSKLMDPKQESDTGA